MSDLMREAAHEWGQPPPDGGRMSDLRKDDQPNTTYHHPGDTLRLLREEWVDAHADLYVDGQGDSPDLKLMRVRELSRKILVTLGRIAP